MYSLVIEHKLDKVFSKLASKNSKQFAILEKKINRIIENPFRFKPLRGSMKNIRRVHIGKSFVLVYEIKETKIILLDYAHHDDVY